MTKRIILYLFPIYIAFAEYFVSDDLLHSGKKPNDIGATIMVIGISLLFPVLLPKRQNVVLQDGTRATITLDMGLVQVAWVFLFVLSGLWVVCLYLANQAPTPNWRGVPVPALIGGSTFIIGVVFTEIKEWRR